MLKKVAAILALLAILIGGQACIDIDEALPHYKAHVQQRGK